MNTSLSLDKATPIVVTGARGFVASYVIKSLLEHGYKVRGTIRSLAKKEKYDFLYKVTPDAKDKIELVEADLLDLKPWDQVFKGVQAVLHVASPLAFEGLSDEDMIKVTVEGMKAVTSAALRQGVKRLIYTSSTVTQVDSFPGPKDQKVDETTWGNVEKMDGYSKSKYYAEKELWKFYEENKGKIEIATILPGLIAGPVLGGDNLSTMGIYKDYVGAVPGYLEQDSTIPLTGLKDLASLHVKVLESGNINGRRLISNVENITTRQILKILEEKYAPNGFKIQNKEVSIEEMQKVAQSGVIGAGFSLMTVGKGAHFDTSRTKELLGVTFEGADKALADGINSLIDLGFVKV